MECITKLTTECVCCSIEANIFFAQTEVSYFNVSVFIEQQIFELDVTINNVMRMQITETIYFNDEAVQRLAQENVLPKSRDDLCTIEPRALLRKNLVMFQMKI